MGNTYFGCVYFLQEDACLVYLAISCWTVFTGVCGFLLSCFLTTLWHLGKFLEQECSSIFLQFEKADRSGDCQWYCCLLPWNLFPFHPVSFTVLHFAVSPVRRKPELPVLRKDFCCSLLQVVQCISKSQVYVASSPMSRYFYWKLLLSESVTTSKVRRTLNKQ